MADRETGCWERENGGAQGVQGGVIEERVVDRGTAWWEGK